MNVLIQFKLRIVMLVLVLFAPVLAAARLQPGDPPPDRLGLTEAGVAVRLSATPGTVRVVSFWASWCAPCRVEMSVLDQIQKQVSPSELQVIGVNIDNRARFKKLVRNLGKSVGITLTHDRGGSIGRSYGVGPIPHSVIIGRDGRIASIHIGFSEARVDELIAELNALLAAPADAQGQVGGN